MSSMPSVRSVLRPWTPFGTICSRLGAAFEGQVHFPLRETLSRADAGEFLCVFSSFSALSGQPVFLCALVCFSIALNGSVGCPEEIFRFSSGVFSFSLWTSPPTHGWIEAPERPTCRARLTNAHGFQFSQCSCSKRAFLQCGGPSLMEGCT